MLSFEGIRVSIAGVAVLRDLSFSVAAGSTAALIGRNGAGKTTTVRTVMGFTSATGRIGFDGADLTRVAPHRRPGLGIGYAPEDRRLFSAFSVEENLLLPPVVHETAWTLERVYASFPVLRERKDFPGTKLSGGEQQMLAIARVLRMGARVLLLDEPSEGLAPVIVQRIGEIVRDITGQGVAVLLVEQNVTFASTVADRHVLLAQGRVVDRLDNEEFAQRKGELLEHLGM